MTKGTGRPVGGADEIKPANKRQTALVPSEDNLPVVEKAVASLLETTPALLSREEVGIRHFVAEKVTSALVARKVPHDELCLPRVDVFLPAIDAVRYSPVKEAFTALIARAMDKRSAHTVLPAYVDMLKQISADELLLLRSSPKLGRVTPIVDIVYTMPNGQVISAYRNVLPASSVKGLSHKDNVPQYIDNLERLKLLFRPHGQVAAEETYSPLERLVFVRDLIKTAPQRSTPGFERYVIGLSDLGASFLRACLL